MIGCNCCFVAGYAMRQDMQRATRPIISLTMLSYAA
jgi:hypothetical protein